MNTHNMKLHISRTGPAYHSFGLLVLALFLAFILALGWNSSVPAVITIAAAYSTIRIVTLCNKDAANPSLLVFHLFTLLGTLVPIAIQISRGSFRYDFVTSSNFDFEMPFLHLFVAILTVDCFYWLGRPKRPKAILKQKVDEYRFNYRGWWKLCAAYWSIGFIYVALASFSPGLSFYSTVRIEQYLSFQMPMAEFAFATFFIRIYLVFGLVLSYLVWRNSDRRIDFIFGIFTFFIALALVAFFLNPVAVPRMMLFGLMLFIGVCFGLVQSRLHRWSFVLAFFFGFYVLFPFVGSATRSDSVVINSGLDQIAEYMKHGDLDNSIIYVIGYNVIDIKGFSYGNNILSAIFSFVPRSIWPSKSEGLGTSIIQEFGDYFPNVSSPYFLEWYADFGLPGILIGATILAIAMARANSANLGLREPGFALFINAAIFGSMPIILRGSLITAAVLMICFTAAILHFVLIKRILGLSHTNNQQHIDRTHKLSKKSQQQPTTI